MLPGSSVYDLTSLAVLQPAPVAAANLLQWEKLRKTGAMPHLARWYDYVMTDTALQSVAEQHGPKKPTTRKEYVKEVAAAGMGGGGESLAPSLSAVLSWQVFLAETHKNGVGRRWLLLAWGGGYGSSKIASYFSYLSRTANIAGRFWSKPAGRLHAGQECLLHSLPP
jgi:hypothetical protein